MTTPTNAVIQRRLVAAFDLWSLDSDYAQESMARTLTKHLDRWRAQGETMHSLWVLLAEKRPQVSFQEWNEMLEFVDDWEGAE